MIRVDSFAAFVMTYERPLVLLETIRKIQSQSYAPGKILIIDNSKSTDTQLAIAALDDTRVEYFRVGYNAGPAGAAKIGLERLAKEGYEWIFWGDDDDPPDFEDSFEILLRLIGTEGIAPGVVGAVGQRISNITGNILRVGDDELRDQQSIAVDSIAGGQCMIVSAAAVRSGALPDERLFFGFEELDFCLKVKRAGFPMKVSAPLFLRAREKYNRLDYKRPVYTVKSDRGLVRQYYGTRNLLFILLQHGLVMPLFYQLFKTMVKTVYGFRYGWKYGRENAGRLSMAMNHFFRGIRNNKY